MKLCRAEFRDNLKKTQTKRTCRISFAQPRATRPSTIFMHPPTTHIEIIGLSDDKLLKQRLMVFVL